LALSNRDRVGRALEVLARGLGPFVDRHMAAFLPPGRDWLEVMTERARREGRPDRMARSDPRLLLRVVAENPRAFRRPLSKLELAYAREIAEVANRWAHLEPFSDADTGRAIDTIARLLRAAAAETQAGQVSELLPDHHRLATAAEGSFAHEDGLTKPHEPAIIAPAGRRQTAGGETASETATASGEVMEFRDRDGDYLAWVAAHSAGYVINIGRSGHGNARLHRSSCGTITSRAPFTGSDIKVCSESLAGLDEWAFQRNGAVPQRCGICHPPSGAMPVARAVSREANPAVMPGPIAAARMGADTRRPGLQVSPDQPARPSKYDALRDFLAARQAAPVTLTFAQIDLLVGTLPRSARVHRLWWRNEDPSHHHCRSWNDAGYWAHPDMSAQEVTFRPKPMIRPDQASSG